MELIVNKDTVYIVPNKDIKAKEICKYLQDLGIGVRSNYFKDTSDRSSLMICRVGVPIAYIDKYVYMVDKNLMLYRVKDIVYGYMNIPHMVMTGISDSNEKFKTTIRKYVDTNSAQSYYIIGGITAMVKIGPNISKTLLERAIKEAYNNNKITLECVIEQAIIIKHRELRANSKELSIKMLSKRKSGNKYTIIRVYTLKDEYRDCYTKEVFDRESIKIRNKLIEDTYNNSKIATTLKNKGLKVEDTVKVDYMTDYNKREISVRLGIKDECLSQYQYLEKNILENVNLNHAGSVDGTFEDYKIVQFKEDAFVILEGKLRKIDADEFVDETGCRADQICMVGGKKRNVGTNYNLYLTNKEYTPLYREILNYNIIPQLKLSGDAELKLYDGMGEDEFNREIKKEESRVIREGLKKAQLGRVKQIEGSVFKSIYSKDIEAYEQLEKLVNLVKGPIYSRYTDSDTKYFDVIRFEFYTTSYEYNKEEKKQLYKRYKQYFDEKVIELLEESERFNGAGLGLNHFKLNVVITADQRIVYTFSLKAEKLFTSS